jgi:hypothetical protein
MGQFLSSSDNDLEKKKSICFCKRRDNEQIPWDECNPATYRAKCSYYVKRPEERLARDDCPPGVEELKLYWISSCGAVMYFRACDACINERLIPLFAHHPQGFDDLVDDNDGSLIRTSDWEEVTDNVYSFWVKEFHKQRSIENV